MEAAVILAVAASFCTATASVCQRLGARTSEVTGFDPRLILRLVRRPVWLAGIASMILGFGFQLSALRFGPLALVQPTLALELLFVFGYMTAIGSRAGVQRRDWLAAAAMSIGLAAFLCVAAPSGGPAARAGFAVVAGRCDHRGGGAGPAGPDPRTGVAPPGHPVAASRAAGRRDRDLLGVRGRGHQGVQLRISGGFGAIVSNWSL